MFVVFFLLLCIDYEIGIITAMVIICYVANVFRFDAIHCGHKIKTDYWRRNKKMSDGAFKFGQTVLMQTSVLENIYGNLAVQTEFEKHKSFQVSLLLSHKLTL